MKPTQQAYAWAAKERLDKITGRTSVQLLGVSNAGNLNGGAIVYFKVGVFVDKDTATALALQGAVEAATAGAHNFT